MPSPYHKDLYPTDDIPEQHVRGMLRLHYSGKTAREIGKKMFSMHKAVYTDEHVREIIRANTD